MIIVGLFDLGNSSDAFLVLRAQERGMSVAGILSMLVVFNLVYALVSAPAGAHSDRIGRRQLIIGGWLIYGIIYLGIDLAQTTWQIWILYVIYGLYYGLAYGTSFEEAKQELRSLANGKYFSISYEWTEYSGGAVEVECCVYLDGYRHYSHPTWRGALDLLRKVLTKSNPPDPTEIPSEDMVR